MSSPKSKARVVGLVRPLKDVTVTAGETATFECELSYEGIAVEWFLGGTKLEPSDRVSPKTPDWILTKFDSLPVDTHESRPRSGSLDICSQCSVFFAPRCSSFSLSSYKVQDSSWAFDPGFEITQAGRLFCPASVSPGLFLTAAGGLRAGGNRSYLTASVLKNTPCAVKVFFACFEGIFTLK